ncbi:MAG: 3-dehydroquinate synthase [Bacteroidales bacterium]|nr:3-dehydroquinate synthase [Bacteroidales bacterium]
MKQGKLLTGGLASLARELRGDEWRGTRYTILVDENSFNHCLPQLVAGVDALESAEFIEVPTGEECKSLEVAAQVWQTLIEGGADRSHALVCLGGGAVCDLGGFVAAGYMRGIRHLLVPSTLLAMTDAAIGGKTAIDFGGVKNSVGHFYPPVATVIESAFCASLDARQLACGEMEMVKTAAVCDPGLYDRLLRCGTPGHGEIVEVARLKRRIVAADPHDTDVRHILNLGHTFGHAIELHHGLEHGLAVGAGMLVAMYLSVRKCGLPVDVYNTYLQWVGGKMELPRHSLRDIEAMLPLMHHDKKNHDGSLRCVLLRGIGEAMIDVNVDDNEVRDAMLNASKPTPLN